MWAVIQQIVYIASRQSVASIRTDVLETTGPRMFTDVIVQYLLRTYGASFGSHPLDNKAELRLSTTLIGSVAIAPVHAFADGSGDRVFQGKLADVC